MTNSEDDTGNENSVMRENFKPDISASPKSFLKKFRSTCIKFWFGKLTTDNSAVL